MTSLALAQLVAVVLLGTTGQVCLKLALHGKPSGDQPAFLWMRLLRSPWFWLWFGSYLATLALWLMVLRSVPLSQAFPALGLTFALVPLASAMFLGEKVARVQWLGIAVIVVGVGLVVRA